MAVQNVGSTPPVGNGREMNVGNRIEAFKLRIGIPHQ